MSEQGKGSRRHRIQEDRPLPPLHQLHSLPGVRLFRVHQPVPGHRMLQRVRALRELPVFRRVQRGPRILAHPERLRLSFRFFRWIRVFHHARLFHWIQHLQRVQPFRSLHLFQGHQELREHHRDRVYQPHHRVQRVHEGLEPGIFSFGFRIEFLAPMVLTSGALDAGSGLGVRVLLSGQSGVSVVSVLSGGSVESSLSGGSGRKVILPYLKLLQIHHCFLVECCDVVGENGERSHYCEDCDAGTGSGDVD
ncbi:hypothetical protein PRIPAC_71124 [Pristionchus pacificus]|uniref:Uncharacterized protein n=1 Tax=Pristionchus pacificus TaxID=54126 RepID=A0A2A6C6D6_PRIPA|nr:hypothetical protein PRIPAC_71124 [Pristionchus pacificus]|eukprot:PDM73676.1 hypothetical protein PRIPAC_41032 [Pristionchus pacificus]